MQVNDPPSEPDVEGVVFDIKRYALHDGPGIRTTVFLKGCPLRCAWCQNPESRRGKPELLFRAGRCIACGACVRACPRDAIHLEQDTSVREAERCLRCGRCTAACPSLAREISGKKWTPEAVLEEIVRDRVFFEESGGGVTFSGGEPLAQPEFLESTLRGCRREAIHTAVDTSLEAERETLQRLLPLVDLFLCDLKTFDAELHRTWTGVSNERILGNLRFLDHQGAELILRIPLVEGFNCSPDQFRQGIPFMKSLSRLRRVDLLPYHSGGEAKARRMETVPIDVPEPRRPRMGTPDEKTLVCFQKILAEHGFASVVGG